MKFHWSFLFVIALAGVFGIVAQYGAAHDPRVKVRKLDEHCEAVRQALAIDARDLASDRADTRDAAVNRFDGQHGQRSDLEIHLCTGRWPGADRDACWMRRDAACLARIAQDLATAKP